MIDAGMILETEASAIVNRVGMKAAEGGAPAVRSHMHEHRRSLSCPLDLVAIR